MGKVVLTTLFVLGALFVLRRLVSGLLLSLGYSFRDKGDLEAAERCFLKALSVEKAVQRLTGQRRGLALVSTSLGFLYHRQKRIDEAARMFTSAIEIYSDIGRVNDAAPVYGSLGKLYFDSGDLSLAEEALHQALAIYCRRGSADEAVDTTNRLLNLIAERRAGTDGAHTYTNTEYDFSLTVPAEWVTQRLLSQFSDTGGQIAVSHRTHKATLNVSVGPTDLREKETRASALREFLAGVPDRFGDFEVITDAAVGGERNAVCAEYSTRGAIGGAMAARKHGLLSILHGGLEYAVQWSAMPGYEKEIKAIVASFKFEK